MEIHVIMPKLIVRIIVSRNACMACMVFVSRNTMVVVVTTTRSVRIIVSWRAFPLPKGQAQLVARIVRSAIAQVRSLPIIKMRCSMAITLARLQASIAPGLELGKPQSGQSKMDQMKELLLLEAVRRPQQHQRPQQLQLALPVPRLQDLAQEFSFPETRGFY